MRLLANTDGGVSGPDGYIGVRLVDHETGEVLAEHSAAIGEATSNEAEYSAVLWALYQAEAWCAEHLTIRSDSQLIVHQINGRYATRNEVLREYQEEARRTIGRMLHGTLKTFKIEWVKRSENSAADRLTWEPRPDEAARRQAGRRLRARADRRDAKLREERGRLGLE